MDASAAKWPVLPAREAASREHEAQRLQLLAVEQQQRLLPAGSPAAPPRRARRAVALAPGRLSGRATAAAHGAWSGRAPAAAYHHRRSPLGGADGQQWPPPLSTQRYACPRAGRLRVSAARPAPGCLSASCRAAWRSGVSMGARRPQTPAWGNAARKEGESCSWGLCPHPPAGERRPPAPPQMGSGALPLVARRRPRGRCWDVLGGSPPAPPTSGGKKPDRRVCGAPAGREAVAPGPWRGGWRLAASPLARGRPCGRPRSALPPGARLAGSHAPARRPSAAARSGAGAAAVSNRPAAPASAAAPTAARRTPAPALPPPASPGSPSFSVSCCRLLCGGPPPQHQRQAGQGVPPPPLVVLQFESPHVRKGLRVPCHAARLSVGAGRAPCPRGG